MPSLLTIPYDIRSIILDLVLFTPVLERHRSEDFHIAALSTQGLLLTNHQLRSETTDRITHHGPLTYHHTMRLQNKPHVTSTWTHVPLVAKHVPIVHSSITATSTRAASRQNHPGFRRGDGGPVSIVWEFYTPMRRFIAHNRSIHTHKIDHSIGLLDIDILTPTLGPNQRFYPESGAIWNDLTGLTLSLDPNVEYLLTPDFLADFLIGEMGMLLAISYHTASYGAFLYASVGSVRISVDGEIRQTWNLGELLAAFPADGPVESFSKGRERGWKEFYDFSIQSRREHGLYVKEATVEGGR